MPCPYGFCFAGFGRADPARTFCFAVIGRANPAPTVGEHAKQMSLFGKNGTVGAGSSRPNIADRKKLSLFAKEGQSSSALSIWANRRVHLAREEKDVSTSLNMTRCRTGARPLCMLGAIAKKQRA